MAEQETNPVEMKQTETAPMDAQAARKVEQEKMSRRQALRKFGFGAGMAALMVLGVDDLARMVGKRMERMAGDSKIAEQIAHEFREAGVAFADGGGSGGGPSAACQACYTNKQYWLGPGGQCLNNYLSNESSCNGNVTCLNEAYALYQNCLTIQENRYIACVCANGCTNSGVDCGGNPNNPTA